MVQIKAFSLSDDEQALVRRIRRTSDKRELLPMVKELGTRMERRLSPILLKQLGFEKIEQLGKRVNTGPEPFDFSAERDGRIYFINSKAMAKRESTFSISGSNHEAVEFLAKDNDNVDFGYLLMKVSDKDGSKGTAFLFLTA